MGWLHNTVALVTGAGSGLGRAIVDRFIEEGARVVALEYDAAKVEALQNDVRDGLVAVRGDASSLADNRRAVATAVDRFGKLDTLVCNAGLWDGNRLLGSVDDDRFDETFDRIFGLNVKGYVAGAKAAAPVLAKTGGSILYTLSNASFLPDGGGVWYTASKHAGVGIVRQLAFELAPAVRVNGVAPGAFASDLRGPASLGLDRSSLTGDRSDDVIAAALPVDFSPAADDYTGMYVALASARDGRTTTGSVFQCDGGLGVRGIGRVSGRGVS